MFVPFVGESTKKTNTYTTPKVFFEKKKETKTSAFTAPKKPFVPARPWHFSAPFPLPKPDAPGEVSTHESLDEWGKVPWETQMENLTTLKK